MGSKAIRRVFAECNAGNRAALVTYLTQGDPDKVSSIAYMKSLVDAGADVIELGVPFSDPCADGPVIEAAMLRSLQQGGGLSSALRACETFRRDGYSTPIVLFGYYNPFFVLGAQTLAQRASDAGVDAMLTVDLPVDELEELRVPLAQCDVGVVPLLAPTSTPERIEAVAKLDGAFVYYVSKAGITGSEFAGAAGGKERVQNLQAATSAPVAVGFGIKSAADARQISPYADGIVVGSAIVSLIAEASSPKEGQARIAKLAKELSTACQR